MLMRLIGSHSRLIGTQEMWQRRESNLKTSVLAARNYDHRPRIFISECIWSKSSTVFVFTTFNGESGEQLYLSLLMFQAECGKKWNISQTFAEPPMELNWNFSNHVERNNCVVL
jgi:hypothetical protein